MRPALVCLLAALATAAGAADDPVQAKLDKAKAAYQAAREKNKEYLIGVLTKQEDAARKAGKLDLVERVKKARDDYEGGGPLPGGLAKDVRARFTTARTAMESAYTEAARELVKAKNDAAADAVKAEWEAFKLDASDDPNVVRVVNRNSLKFLTVTKPEGDATEPEVKQEGERSAGTDQYFRVVPAGKTGAVFLQTLDGKKLLSTAKGGVSQGAELVIAPLRSGALQQTQLWQMVPSPDGWGRLYHPASKKVVGVYDKSKGNGASVVIWSNEKDAPHMDWKFD